MWIGWDPIVAQLVRSHGADSVLADDSGKPTAVERAVVLPSVTTSPSRNAPGRVGVAAAVSEVISNPTPTEGTAADVTVYWRPACGFCRRLLRRLDRADIAYTKVNIWDHPEAAAFVRSVAGGNETVPTVVVGGTALVNPSFRQLRRILAG